MIGVVIVAHGGLAKEYLSAIEHVVGRQKDVIAVGASAECDRNAKEEEICAAANKVDSGDGVVIVVDLFGSSPANLSKKACFCEGRKIVYGANLPMLIKLVKCRNSDLETAVARALDAGHKYLDVMPSAGAARSGA